MGQSVKKKCPAHWVMEAITLEYTSSGPETPLGLCNHSPHRMAASWALFQGVSVLAICWEESLSSPVTLFGSICLTRQGQSMARTNLGPNWNPGGPPYWPVIVQKAFWQYKSYLFNSKTLSEYYEEECLSYLTKPWLILCLTKQPFLLGGKKFWFLDLGSEHLSFANEDWRIERNACVWETASPSKTRCLYCIILSFVIMLDDQSLSVLPIVTSSMIVNQLYLYTCNCVMEQVT